MFAVDGTRSPCLSSTNGLPEGDPIQSPYLGCWGSAGCLQRPWAISLTLSVTDLVAAHSPATDLTDLAGLGQLPPAKHRLWQNILLVHHKAKSRKSLPRSFLLGVC